MKKKNLFAIYTLAGIVLTVICGIESLFENPIGLIVLGIIIGITCAIVCVSIYALAEKINPAKTKKFIEFILRED